MASLLAVLTFISLLIWVYLLVGRGQYWRIRPASAPHGVPSTEKRVIAIIPARNEAAVIGESVVSLLTENSGAVDQVIVVDDASTDGTAAAAARAAQNVGKANKLFVITGKPLIAGWTGKLWALSQGVERALTFEPDYLLLTDADIRHGRHGIRTLIAIADARDCDLASYMVRLVCKSWAEQALIPAFVYFFLQLYPPAWISARRARTAGAAGGCILICPEALTDIGGLNAIRNEIIDDCALARAIKRSGGKLWMGLASDTHSIRGYGSIGEIEKMISRTAFSQLKHSVWLLVLTITGLTITYIVPIAALFSGKWQIITFGAVAWVLMIVSYFPMVKFYKVSLVWCLALPVIAVFYAGATLHSAIQFWSGKGGEWKGRLQDKDPQAT